MIFVACTGAAVMLQAFVLLGMFLTARKALKFAQEQTDEMRNNVLPLIKDTKELLTRIGPKIESVANDVADLASRVRVQSTKVEASAGAMLERVHRQSNRVDMMVTHALDTVDRASSVVAEVISAPIRQLSGIAAFARAAFSTLRTGPPPAIDGQPTHSSADRDLFV